MSNIIDNLPEYTLDKLKSLRANAVRLLEDPKRGSEAHIVLDAIDNEIAKRTLPGMISSFKEHYPGGFYGDLHAEEERDYKVGAVHTCQKLLSKEDFQLLLTSKNFDELDDRFKKLLNCTNFLHPTFERARWVEQVTSYRHKGDFYTALFELIHGTGAFNERFNCYLNQLQEMNFLKWTSATYFLFLAAPDQNIFIKPEMLKKSLDLSQYPLSYSSEPSPELYSEIVKFSHWLFDKIKELEPRDLIDVHSFMWHMAPTGIHSKD